MDDYEAESTRYRHEYKREVWQVNAECRYFVERAGSASGGDFFTAKKLPFRYSIRGGEMFVDRRSRSITKATFSKALQKLEEEPEKIKGPKSLNVFGAPYVWSILRTLGMIKRKEISGEEIADSPDSEAKS